MTIRLYNNSSDARVLSKQITKLGSDITCRLTDECTVEDPSFKMTLSSDFLSANYLYVADWNKYYFIQDRTILNNNEIVLNCHIDVLMSFKDSLLNSQIVAERSSSDIDDYIPDTVVADRGTVKQYFRRITTTPFSLETNCYVLHLAGKRG